MNRNLGTRNRPPFRQGNFKRERLSTEQESIDDQQSEWIKVSGPFLQDGTIIQFENNGRSFYVTQFRGKLYCISYQCTSTGDAIICHAKREIGDDLDVDFYTSNPFLVLQSSLHYISLTNGIVWSRSSTVLSDGAIFNGLAYPTEYLVDMHPIEFRKDGIYINMDEIITSDASAQEQRDEQNDLSSSGPPQRYVHCDTPRPGTRLFCLPDTS